ncbi:MAG: P-II family nitrogen regulator [Chitinispirillaceae bacterium]
MKLVIAILQSHKLDAVMKALDEREIYLKTVSNVLGCGRQKGVSEVYRGVREAGNLIKKVRLEIAVNDSYLQPTIEAIMKGAQTGKIGDGKIFVLELAEWTGHVAIG